jgi:hypothetical protein
MDREPQERLSNPFEDADSIGDEEDVAAAARAHASYFPDLDFKSSELELELELGLGLGSNRASIEDVLGLSERLRTYTGPVDVQARLVAMMEGERGILDGGVVVPIVTIQAPSNEDGISLLSSEVDLVERMQSPDEEELFYNGGPRGFAARRAFGAGRE